MDDIKNLQLLFTNYLNENRFDENPKELYEPNNYFLSIGGKRIRPTMLLLGTQLFDKNPEIALPAALSIEYFHNFTLIHDDVMDKASLRRGFVTIHEKYGLNTSILSGDVLLIKAYQYLSQIDKQYLPFVFELFNKTAIEVCEGQQMDMNFETQDIVSLDDYLKMITLKTSVLLAVSLQIGAILGGASMNDAEALYHYALNLGIAFQIQDDLLDTFGDGSQVGKKIGGDILQNKKTLLSIRALELELEEQKTAYQNLISTNKFENQEKINAVLEIYNHYNIKSFGELKRDEFVNKSILSLDKINFSPEKKQKLKKLVTLLVYREL